MKTLYFARHAKSSWKHDVDDHQRPLKSRGRSDASLVSDKAATEMKPPQFCISSDAVRAKTTAAYFVNAFKVADENFKLDHSLYDFSGQQVMSLIKELDDSYNRVMIFGHNHAFTSIVNMLGNEYIENVPTSGFVAIEFDSDSWQNITVGKTIKTIFPRNLK
ncbi:SixA phosphatase family protein [Patiriisocius marinus]|uniref:Phosphohistidine phosphatase SixA n=1 Tax=Patiriisocius marinus TaxID=1397112 RepID=A0A5J4IRI3_9FLAO|nr:histidine phosphatase family protein [Patiriisocius marinus]GER60505.1 phosphohistidine phosphatase SixA [Patiriisocius marinus]